MSAGPSSCSSPLVNDASSFALEAQYVHLNTQLLQHLQRGQTLQALQVAESIRDLCVNAPANASADPTAAYGAALYSSSPAELLLTMRSELSPTVGDSTREGRAVAGEHGRAEERDEKERKSGSATPTNASLETSTSSLSHTTTDSSNESSSDDDHEDADGSTAAATRFSSLSRSSDLHAVSESAQQHQQEQFSVLAAALTRWSHLNTAAEEVTSSQESKAGMTNQRTPGKPIAISGPTPPPSRPPPRRLAEKSRSVPTSLLPQSDVNGTGSAEGRDGGAEVDEEADEAWRAMQQQVAKEMERLAVVRKHR